MATHCSVRNSPCSFCGEAIDQASQSVVSIQMLAQGDLFVCENCHAISTFQTSSQDTGPKGQASFHELFFGSTPTHFLSYINDAKLLRRVITNDYPAYFGNKATELIFEVGAGRGSFLKALHDEGYSAIGCEYSAKLVDAGRAAYELPDNILFQLNAWDLPEFMHSNSIRPTVLIFWHVIEHIENCFVLLEPLVKACADKVTIIFQTPLPVPEYVYPEHLFFPTTETYHLIAERLGLSVKLLYIIPYTRFITCVLSSKDVPEGKIYPRQIEMAGFSVLGQLIAQFDSCLQELNQVAKEQYKKIVSFESRLSCLIPSSDMTLTLANDLSQIADFLKANLPGNNTRLNQMMQQMAAENQGLRNELLQAEAQLTLLKDLFLNSMGDDSL